MAEYLYLLLVVFHFTTGCTLSGDEKLQEVIGHTGGSVLLSCSCTDLQTKPQILIWRTSRKGYWSHVFSDEYYKGRVQRFNETSPGNFSLLISDLRKEDKGFYRCETDLIYRDFIVHVTVQHGPTFSPKSHDQQTSSSLHIGLWILIISLLTVCFGAFVAFFCWRHRERSGQNVVTEGHSGPNGKHKDQSGSEVTYSTIAHRNTDQPAHVQISTENLTEYASIKTSKPKETHKDIHTHYRTTLNIPSSHVSML